MVGEPHIRYLYRSISNEDATTGNFTPNYEFINGWDPQTALNEVLVYQPPISGAYFVEILDPNDNTNVVARYDPHNCLEKILKEE
jgi:hypothetical protein